MIARGSRDESEARRHIALWQGMIRHWNIAADEYRDGARGKAPVTSQTLDEADRTRSEIRAALELCDILVENLAPGHEQRSDLFQVSAALEALSESIAISTEQMAPRIEAAENIAGLKYLVSALRRDANLPVTGRG